MKYYLIAGEASGDLHGSNLMAALKKSDKEAEFRFFGGDLMQLQGGTIVKHYKEMAFMGFIPVLLNLRTILRNLELCKEDIRNYKPDSIILIDYPGFNLKIAKYVKTVLQIPVVYYISPKVWAWKEYRVKSFKKYVDKMLCILPFEVNFFKKHNYPVTYVGNPTVDAVEQYKQENQGDTKELFISESKLQKKPIVALLAGSRKQEIKDNLPTMIQAFEPFQEKYQAVIAGAPGIDPEYYNEFTNDSVKIVFGQTYRLLSHSEAAFVTSGTATLETSLFRVPQAVSYKTPIPKIVSYVFEHFFHTKYISLVNLIADKVVVKELFAKYFSLQALTNEMNLLLNNAEYRSRMLKDYDEVIAILDTPGASERAAGNIVGLLQKK
ncbi:MAG: glycosyltransferase family 19, candidate lipid-alpha-disaccharide synthase [Bacteroidetes bacterium]|nr:glycosyltransferase family 19, candidate lipid-alpha-disaccharide synthase [Bacteroidota bacterium]